MSKPMTSQRSPKWWALYITAITLGLTGVVILIVRHDFVFRTFAVLAFVASARLVRMAVQSRSVSSAWQIPSSKVAEGPGRLLWGASIALLPLAGLSLFLLYQSAVDGYHELWPAKMFVGVAIVCAVVWSCLAYNSSGKACSHQTN
jgi:hypothetical protein